MIIASLIYLAMLSLSVIAAGRARSAARRGDWPQVVVFSLTSLIIAMAGCANLIVSFLGGHCG
jgi:hypothetical protein